MVKNTAPVQLGSNVSKTLVAVSNDEYGELSGVYCNPFLPAPQNFGGLTELIGGLDRFFNWLGFPQAFNECRSFQKDHSETPHRAQPQEVKKYMDDSIFETKLGEKATFVIQVQFRQNSSWQGTITWTEKRKTQKFRSTLEMIRLMDSALSECAGEKEIAPPVSTWGDVE